MGDFHLTDKKSVKNENSYLSTVPKELLGVSDNPQSDFVQNNKMNNQVKNFGSC